MCCMTDGDPWSVKQHHWKSEAKEDNQLSPCGPSNRRKLRSQPTKLNSFRSGLSWSLTPECVIQKRKTRQLYPTVTMLLLYPAREGLCGGNQCPNSITPRQLHTHRDCPEFVLIVMIATKNKTNDCNEEKPDKH